LGVRKLFRGSLYNAGNTPKRAIYPTAVKRLPRIKALFGGRELVARRVLAEIGKNPHIPIEDLALMISREFTSKGIKVYTTPKTAAEKSGLGVYVTPGLVDNIVGVLQREKIIKNLAAKKRTKGK